MCLLTDALLHGSEYDWMEPASIVPSIQDGGSSRSVVRGAAVVIVLVVQLLICIAGSRRETLATVVLLGSSWRFIGDVKASTSTTSANLAYCRIFEWHHIRIEF